MNSKIFKFWFIALFIKIIIGIYLPLSPDECYYWVWSHNLQLSYFDHPPMVAIFFWLGHIFEGFQFAVRVPAIILSHLSILFWLKISENKISENNQIFFLVLFLFSPLLGFGSLIITPDLPLMIFWAMALYAFEKIESNPNKKINYALFGLALGLGGLSKYHMIFFPLIAVIYLSLNKKWEIIFNKKYLLTLFISAVVISPVLIWNYQNDFVSIRFQLHHGFASHSFTLKYFFEYILGQGFLFGFIFLTLGIISSLREPKKLTSLLNLFPMGFFMYSSLRAHVEMNWPVISHPTILISALSKKTNKFFVYLYVLIFGSLFALVGFQGISLQKKVINEKISEFARIQEVASEALSFQPIYASSYQLASTLWFISKKPIYKLYESNRHDFFDDMNPSPQLENLFYIIYDETTTLPDWINNKPYKMQLVREINSQYKIYKVEKAHE